MGAWNLLTAALLSALSLASLANGYDVKFSDTDDLRQVCTGMWANDKTYLNGIIRRWLYPRDKHLMETVILFKLHSTSLLLGE